MLKIVDLQAAQKLFNTVEDDVSDYAFQQGPEAVDALSLWPDDDLKQYGAELALRSKKDGKILADLRELISSGPVDPEKLTPKQQALINAIAENSTQYGDGKQVVLGKWVDRGSGFAKIAKDTGSVHYDPHGQFWEMYKELGESKDKVAWLVNQKVIQTGVEKGLPFEYSLNGIPDNKVSAEMNAIKAVFAGATSEEVVDILGAGYLPFRLMELQELHQAGYKYVFDEVTNSFILVATSSA